MINILIVDDEEIIRNMLMESLSDKGYRVFEAVNGSIGEKMIYSEKFDLVISDVMMPEMNGFELLTRTKFVNPKIKFIVMTGYHKPENVPMCLQYNVSRYVKKPFNIDEMVTVVEEVINEKEVEAVKSFQQNLKGWIEIEVTSTEDSVLRVYNYMKQYLDEYLQKDTLWKIFQAFYEILQNAIEWGNKFDKNRHVSIGCLVLSDRVVFKIQDEGQGFNITEAINPIKDPIARQEDRGEKGKRPGGFGLEISNKLMDEFYFNKKGNCVIMTKNFDNVNMSVQEKTVKSVEQNL